MSGLHRLTLLLWLYLQWQAREAALPRGTPQLATLYASHAAGLHRLIRAGRVPPNGQAGAAAQAAQALGAAARIRDTCFGGDHPLAASTLVAAERAAKNAARLASAAAAS